MSFNAGDIQGTLTLDRDPFNAGLAQARRDAEQWERKHFSATLDADSSSADRKVGGLYSDLRKMAAERTRARIDVDTSGATRGIMGVRRQLTTLPDPTVTVHIATERATMALAGLLRQVGSFKVTAVATLLAVAPAAIVAGTAVGGIGVAALGVLGPIGLLGAAMQMSFKRGGPSIKAFTTELQHLKGAFEYATGPATRAGFAGLTDAISEMRSVLPGLRDNLTGLGKAAGASFRALGRELASVDSQDFYATMTNLATKALPSLTGALRSVLAIFRNIATAGAPLLLKALRGLDAALKDIARRTSDIGMLRASMDAGAQAGAKLWQIGKNLAGVLKGIFTAASTGSGSFLDSLVKASRQLSIFFQSSEGQKVLRDTLASLSLYVTEIAAAIPALVKAFGMLLDIVRPLFTLMIGLVKTLSIIPGIGPGLAAIAVGFLAWKGPIGVAVGLLRGIPLLLGRIKAARVTGSLVPLVPGSIGGRAAAASKAGAVGSTGSVVAGSLAGAGPAAAREGEAASKGFLARFGAGLRAGWPRVLGVFKSMLGSFGPLLRRIPGLAAVGSIFAAAFASIGPKMGAVVTKGFALLGRTFLPAALKLVGQVLVRGVFGWPGLIASIIWMLLPKKVKDAIIGALKDAGRWMLDALKSAGKGIADAAVWMMNMLAKGLIMRVTLPMKAVKAIGEKLWDVVKSIGPKFLAAGKAIIGMLGDGIVSQAGAVVNAVKSVVGKARDLLPFSEPRDRSSPLYGLGRSGEAILKNVGGGLSKGTERLRKQVQAALEAAYAPIRNAAQQQLYLMDVQDAIMQGPAPTRGQQRSDIYGRISAARYATDDQGRLLNLPPPGVARVADKDERDAMDELAALERSFRHEDLTTAAEATVNVNALIPSDPNVLKAVQRGMAKAIKHATKKKPRRKRLA